MAVVAHINRIATAVPPHEVHRPFVAWAERRVDDRRGAALFRRMADRSGIARRWSVLAPPAAGGGQFGPHGFYGGEGFPTTAMRMAVYAEQAPALALRAVRGLGALGPVSHLVVASCTGFIAPGLDQLLAAELGLDPAVERTFVGFMGCYAAVAALRLAHHLVRSEPAARVLVVAAELCTLHLQDTGAVDALLAMLQFGDGAAAALVTADPVGLAIERPFARAIPDSAELIRWDIRDQGFEMQLAGAVPGRIAAALGDAATRAAITGADGAGAGGVDAWAVHAGGRSVLDAVERALALPVDALDHARGVLAEDGNMSSATLLFVLARWLADRAAPAAAGVAVAFGPGLVAEGFGFRRAA